MGKKEETAMVMEGAMEVQAVLEAKETQKEERTNNTFMFNKWRFQ